MKKHLKFIYLIVICLGSFLLSSCIQEEYNFKDGIDTTIKVLGDNFTIPLGATDSIKIKKLLDKMESDMIILLSDGTYALNISGNESIDVPLLDRTQLNFGDYSLPNESISMGVGAIGNLNVSVSAMTFDGDEFSLGLPDLDLSDLKIPAVSLDNEIAAGLNKYDFDATLENVTVQSLISGDFIPSDKFPAPIPGINEIPISSLNNYIVKSDANQPFSTTKDEIPDEVKAINLLEFNTDPYAKLEIKVIVEDFDLIQGSIIPQYKMILPSFIKLKDSGNTLTFNTPLSGANNYQTIDTYDVESFDLSGFPINDQKLNISGGVFVESHFQFSSDAMIATDDIQSLADMEIHFEISLKDMNVANSNIEINPVTETLESDIDNPELIEFEIELPEEISSVDNIYMVTTGTDKSTILLDVEIENIDKFDDLDFKMSQLTIHFPDQIKFNTPDVDATGLYSKQNLMFTSGKLSIELPVSSIDMSGVDQTNGIKFSEAIIYSAAVITEGGLDTKDLPKTPAEDINIKISVNSKLNVDNADITTNTFSHALTDVSYTVNQIVDLQTTAVKEVGNISLTDAKLTLDIDMPTLPAPMAIIPSDAGLKMTFPPMFKFKAISDPDYSLDLLTNTLSFNPGTAITSKTIELEIDKLAMNEMIDDGELEIGGEVTLTGGFKVNPASINTSGLANLNQEVIGFNAGMSAFSIASIEVKGITQEIAPLSFDFELKMDDFPDMVKTIDMVEFNNTTFALDLTLPANSIFDNADISIELELELPAEMRISIIDTDHITKTEEGNLLIKKNFSNNNLTIDGIKIDSLVLSSLDVTNGFEWKKSFNLKGSVYITESLFNPSDVENTNLTAEYSVEIENIELSKVEGIIDYKLDETKLSVSLEDVPDFLKDENFVLDFANPFIILDVESNIGIPVKGDAEVIPFINDIANESNKLAFSLSLPFTLTGESKTESYYLGTKAPDAGSGYKFIEADITKLVKTIPDSLQFVLDMYTDTSVDKHVFDANVSYFGEIKYDVYVPFAVGEDFNISLRDTLDNIPSILTTLLKGNSISLIGEIENSLPLRLEMTITALDEENNVINAVSSSKQIIEGCSATGTSTKSALDITLSSTSKEFNSIASLELLFKATQGTDSGEIPVGKDSFVKAVLKLKTEGGITIDIDEL